SPVDSSNRHRHSRASVATYDTPEVPMSRQLGAVIQAVPVTAAAVRGAVYAIRADGLCPPARPRAAQGESPYRRAVVLAHRQLGLRIRRGLSAGAPYVLLVQCAPAGEA